MEIQIFDPIQLGYFSYSGNEITQEQVSVDGVLEDALVIDVSRPFDIEIRLLSKSYWYSDNVETNLACTVCGTEKVRTNGRVLKLRIEIVKNMSGDALTINLMQSTDISQ